MKKIVRILDTLSPHFDEVEILYQEKEEYNIGFENSLLSHGRGDNISTYAIRVIKDGKLAFTVSNDTSSKNIKKVLNTLKDLVKHGTNAEYHFPKNNSYKEVKHYTPSIKKISSSDMYEIGKAIINKTKESDKEATLNVSITKNINNLTYANSYGILTNDKLSAFSYSAYMLYPGMGTGTGIWSSSIKKTRPSVTDIKKLISNYKTGLNGYTPESGKMPIIFTPKGLFAFIITLIEGVNAENIIRQTSPLKDKIGETIFSEKLNVKDMPIIDSSTYGRIFDDEGVACYNKTIVENGILKTYINDIRTAHIMKEKPTGNGYKRAMFGGGIESLPRPYIGNAVIEKGNIPLKEMIADIKKGVIIENIMGFHSSNYLSGQISGQILGFYIENGKIKGRVDGTMLSMNIYKDMQNIEISSETEKGYLGESMPYIMIKDISITGR